VIGYETRRLASERGAPSLPFGRVGAKVIDFLRLMSSATHQKSIKSPSKKRGETARRSSCTKSFQPRTREKTVQHQVI
jgi:hypothetical protein